VSLLSNIVQFASASSTEGVSAAHPSHGGWSDPVEVDGCRRPLLAVVGVGEADDDVEAQVVVRELRPTETARSIPAPVDRDKLLAGPVVRLIHNESQSDDHE